MTVKRSLSVRGHRTSITLEEAFWRRLNRLAVDEGVSAAELVARIDEARDPTVNLSSALRVHMLEEALARLEPERGPDPDS
ncbi:ribbon-helix-helix domain-containing protein [Fulvimarina sp. 2208YS6-2-32]|uniref:Ribbon-helix-helix domain-containing protein n=1 Tax=Fulvimarina uroteuthidis TaxID=3098149 RepID=A0ABU5HZU1_9HYPH|nr:ribbon-helix-helix domain-containing protein [Fulvimarina sp. 2208YS6-2-32]MDY8108607.1 ribbon-helix-helix domain-containing protein [Fulvimarina sp. 2208YS6-2-32]